MGNCWKESVKIDDCDRKQSIGNLRAGAGSLGRVAVACGRCDAAGGDWSLNWSLNGSLSGDLGGGDCDGLVDHGFDTSGDRDDRDVGLLRNWLLRDWLLRSWLLWSWLRRGSHGAGRSGVDALLRLLRDGVGRDLRLLRVDLARDGVGLLRDLGSNTSGKTRAIGDLGSARGDGNLLGLVNGLLRSGGGNGQAGEEGNGGECETHLECRLKFTGKGRSWWVKRVKVTRGRAIDYLLLKKSVSDRGQENEDCRQE